MLYHTTILIVDDEPIIGMALSGAVIDAGGKFIGPAASVKAALSLLEAHFVSGAILDVNLTDGLVSPVVDYLMERQIPLIVQTGVGIPEELALRYPDIVVRIKPNCSDDLVAELAQMIRHRETCEVPTMLADNDTDMSEQVGSPEKQMDESSHESGTAV